MKEKLIKNKIRELKKEKLKIEELIDDYEIKLRKILIDKDNALVEDLEKNMYKYL